MATIIEPSKADASFNWPGEDNLVRIDGEDFYRIANYDQMAPFLMTIVSAGDLWMYVSSTGGLTAGRVSADQCLFPYETANKLHDCHGYTGPMTVFRCSNQTEAVHVWQPFQYGHCSPTNIRRYLYKHVAGNQLIFEETHEELGLTFRYRWRTSSDYGFVRTATLENHRSDSMEIDVVDGLQNIMPFGVDKSTCDSASCVIDAYRHNECDLTTRIAIFSLTTKIHDRPQAAEVLKATTAWGCGFDKATVLLSPDQLRTFHRGEPLRDETISKGQRSNYFLAASLKLGAGQSQTWNIVAEVAQDHSSIADLHVLLRDHSLPEAELEASIVQDHQELLRNVASADGLQATGNELENVHHFANVLFNNMRGGVFASNYEVEARDFIDYVSVHNRDVRQEEQAILNGLPARIQHRDLLTPARQSGNRDLLRLSMEYLPLVFSRRHGDPSRPWNQFEIRVRNDDGTRAYHYQGNWRDIFQNWEALCQSFPGFLPSIVAKFVNASTIDGFNPYRITHEGIDWEVPDPDDTWSNIGYWCDHQIIYLTKLLESLQHHFPERLQAMLHEDIFCYAQVPYHIKAYEKLLKNCRETIEFDCFVAEEIDCRVSARGADGKLVTDSNGHVYYVNLIEKLLVPILSKLSNFVFDGGIWLNTQRPEWNDANNALAGPGLSVVTVCYLRRHLQLLVKLLQDSSDTSRITISGEVKRWFQRIFDALQAQKHLLSETHISDADRRRLLDQLGRAFSEYRIKVYADGFSGKQAIGISDVIDFLHLATEYLDHTILLNGRSDRLYHSYNILEINEEKGTASVGPLYEMLEGQVAALSSGVLDDDQVIELVRALFASQLYRPDQSSFMLYPDRELNGFRQRNVIPHERVQSVELLRRQVESGDTSVIIRDVQDETHFHGNIKDAADLTQRLEQLAIDPACSELVTRDKQAVLEVFAEVFGHRTFTGRSGAIYGYEGLGCIYWHMASKLLLAVQECFFRALDRQAPSRVIQSLADAYYLVRRGLSPDRTPAQFGAFPTDPYSHSPKQAGAQQPGMTGQVKEEILTRRGELGVRVRDGVLHFEPYLLRRREFVEVPTRFWHYDVKGNGHWLELEPASLALTVCQVPVVYHLTDGNPSTMVQCADGRKCPYEDDSRREFCKEVFARTGNVTRFDVTIQENMIASD